MEREKPSEIDITAPASTMFIFQEVNRRDWCMRLTALVKALPFVDFKFAQVSKGYPLDTRSKLRLSREIAKAEVVSKYPACPSKWDEITDNYVSDGYAIAVLDLVLDVLSQENIHLIPRTIDTEPAKDFRLTALSSGVSEQFGSDKHIPKVPAGETGVIPFLSRVFGCALGSVLGLLLGLWLLDDFFADHPSQISLPETGEVEEFNLSVRPQPLDPPAIFLKPVRPMEVE